MIIENQFEGRTEKEVKEIKGILEIELPKRVDGREQGFGENWDMDKEKKLQDWLDKISNKYKFDVRLYYLSTESLYFKDYQRFVIYG